MIMVPKFWIAFNCEVHRKLKKKKSKNSISHFSTPTHHTHMNIDNERKLKRNQFKQSFLF